VSWTQVDVSVRWYNDQLFCTEVLGGGSFLDGFLESGWFRADGPWGVGEVSSCSISGYTGNVVHGNASFPPCSLLNAMFLYWEPTSAYVDENGYAYGDFYTYTSGGECRFLLSVSPCNGVLSRWDS
jgi:hypothetical protein